MGTSRIVPLVGVIDGINTEFNTPSIYADGSVVLVWNGQIVESDDVIQGWTETGGTGITTTIPPQVGDVLQAFYQETIGTEGVVGSPFHPTNELP